MWTPSILFPVLALSPADVLSPSLAGVPPGHAAIPSAYACFSVSWH